MKLIHLLVLGLSFSSLSFAANTIDATVELTRDTTQPIKDLEIRADQKVTRTQDYFSGSVQTVHLEGNYRGSKEKELTVNRTHIVVDQDSRFKVDVPIESSATDLDFVAVDPYGKIERENVKLTVSVEVRKQIGLTPSLAYTYLTYDQTGISSFAESAVTLKVSYHHKIPRFTFLEGDAYGFFTQPIITPNANSSIQVLSFGARVGYGIPAIKSPWKLTIFGGYYYRTSFTPQNLYGYTNLAAFQLYPALQRELPNGDSVLVYLKYAPFVGGNRGFQFSNREIAGGAAWTHLLKNEHPLRVTLDVAQLSLASDTSSLNSFSISLGGGYGF